VISTAGSAFSMHGASCAGGEVTYSENGTAPSSNAPMSTTWKPQLQHGSRGK
jgi:hypothetical protein